MSKKTIFSGIKPSGQLTIGNYIGAISQWPKLQEEYNCIFSIADYHAITVKQEPKELRQRIREITKTYLAAGIDPEKAIIFQQSTISAHAELAWILSCYGARMADLSKMTQFKDKAGKGQESVSVGLFSYPILMAADILLYDAELIPVGEDQKQHVELARDLAKRFNNDFGSIFKIPQTLIRSEGSRVMSLQDSRKKMSKSDLSNNNDYVLLQDDVESARKKIKKAITDSGFVIDYDLEEKPAISNLLTIYAFLGNREIKRLVKDYKDKNYGEFKQDLAEVVVKFLEDFQNKYNSLDDAIVDKILEDGYKWAQAKAEEKMEVVRRAIGVR